jgi:hypothetical protein
MDCFQDVILSKMAKMSWKGEHLFSFHPETALFPNLCVNPHACVCGVNNYASVQALDFLDLGKNFSFPI